MESRGRGRREKSVRPFGSGDAARDNGGARKEREKGERGTLLPAGKNPVDALFEQRHGHAFVPMAQYLATPIHQEEFGRRGKTVLFLKRNRFLVVDVGPHQGHTPGEFPVKPIHDGHNLAAGASERGIKYDQLQRRGRNRRRRGRGGARSATCSQHGERREANPETNQASTKYLGHHVPSPCCFDRQYRADCPLCLRDFIKLSFEFSAAEETFAASPRPRLRWVPFNWGRVESHPWGCRGLSPEPLHPSSSLRGKRGAQQTPARRS